MRSKTLFPSGLIAFVAMAGFAFSGHAQVVTLTERLDDTGNFQFSTIPDPSSTDLLEGATATVVSGTVHGASGPVSVLTDGSMQTNSNDTANSFFFGDTEADGRLLFNLGTLASITQINTYSWHLDARAPQVFNVYGATGTETDFSANPTVGNDPTALGYTLIAQVNTTSLGLGGQQGSSIQLTGGGSLGNYQYLLFDIFPGDGGTDPIADGGTDTFFGEIDVVGSAVVPEPSTYGLIGIGAGLAGLLHRRRRGLGAS